MFPATGSNYWYKKTKTEGPSKDRTSQKFKSTEFPKTEILGNIHMQQNVIAVQMIIIFLLLIIIINYYYYYFILFQESIFGITTFGYAC
jgi:hypothetical protein